MAGGDDRRDERRMSGRRIILVALVVGFAALQLAFAAWAGSLAGIVLALLAIALAVPWPFLSAASQEEPEDARDERIRLRRLLIVLAILAAVASFIASVSARSDTPEGRAAAAQREKERRIERAMDAARERAEEVAQQAERDKERAFGQHCASPWNGSYGPLVKAVEQDLRNPDSFDHVETHGTRIDANGHHRFTMTFRAENGFGGVNIETAQATVRSEDCTMISWRFGG